MRLRILHQDEHCVAIDKPAGFHVHPPEDSAFAIPKHQNCLYILKNQINHYLYPVHRLDRATSGVLLFALTPEFAHQMALLFREHRLTKTYFCVTRGWTPEQGVLDRALKSEDKQKLLPSNTQFTKLAQVELPFPVGRYPTARYSLLKVLPQTGRFHQIRRHFRGEGYPLIGDTQYGDTAHNRFFREQLNIRGLMLKAYSLNFKHPMTSQSVTIQSRWGSSWIRTFDLFGICPFNDSR